MKTSNTIKNKILSNYHNDILPSDLHRMNEKQLMNQYKKVLKKEKTSDIIAISFSIILAISFTILILF